MTPQEQVSTPSAASLLFLGTSRGEAVADRFFSSPLLESASATLLIDAGEPCSQRLVANERDPLAIHAILVTHPHSDHVGGLPMLLQTMHIRQRRSPLKILLPGELRDPFCSWMSALCLPITHLGFPVEFHAWEDGPATLGDVRMTPYPGTHLAQARQKQAPADMLRFKSYSLRLDLPGRAAVFTGDIAAAADFLPLCREPVDLLVAEGAHLSPSELFEALQGVPVARLALVHLGEQAAEHAASLAELKNRILGPRPTLLLATDNDLVAI